ncbi:MAG: hypothetical protein VB070_15800 [Clostridiaceae bacterium]|nr:hypothetical protein [Clostridiaceae bacterium]
MNQGKLVCTGILLSILLLASGCGINNKDTFPVLPDQRSESVIITNGLMGIDLPQEDDEATIRELREFIKKIDYIEKDDTEIIGGYYGVSFVFHDSSIRYNFLRNDYAAVKINNGEYIQYRIGTENGTAIYNYLQEYVSIRSQD